MGAEPTSDRVETMLVFNKYQHSLISTQNLALGLTLLKIDSCIVRMDIEAYSSKDPILHKRFGNM